MITGSKVLSSIRRSIALSSTAGLVEGPNALSSAAAQLKFPRDSYLRRRWFHLDSFQHQAKANLSMLRWIAKQYLEPGRLVIDPMGGTGSLFILASDGFPVGCGELEAWLIPILAANARFIAQRWLFSQAAFALRWDAAKLPFVTGSLPAIVTSPPYWDMFSDWHITSADRMQRAHRGPFGSAYGDDRGRKVKHNIGNIHIYEDFLLAMRAVYCEAWRVLEPGGKLALILKDRVHKGQRVPITRDTQALCLANGFEFVARHDCQTVLSQYRRVNAKHNPEAEVIEHETILVMQKTLRPPPCRVAIVAIPETFSGPTGQLFQKQIAHARASADDVWLLHAPTGLFPIGQNAFDLQASYALKGVKARRRREWCFGICDDLVKAGYGAGDSFMLHAPNRYAAYLQARLFTLGCQVEVSTCGLNAGQKMVWLTRQAAKSGLTPVQPRREAPYVAQNEVSPTSTKAAFVDGHL
jgi:hypothetical protein